MLLLAVNDGEIENTAIVTDLDSPAEKLQASTFALSPAGRYVVSLYNTDKVPTPYTQPSAFE